MNFHNSLRIDQPFESSGYIWFPFSSSEKKFLATIKFHSIHGCRIDMKCLSFDFEKVQFIFEQEIITFAGIFDKNEFL